MASNPFAAEPTFATEPTYAPPGTTRSSMQSAQSEHSVPRTMSQPPVHVPPAKTGVLLFHILFKALALVVYMTNVSGQYVLTFVLVTIFSALDFWTVQKVSGRLLVGLRWLNYIDSDGMSHWKFQSFEDERFVHPTDSNVFWVTLFVAPAIWVLLAFSAAITLRFMWLLLALVALACCAINTVGYVRCKRDASKKLTALGGTVLTRGLQAWTSSRMASAPSAPV